MRGLLIAIICLIMCAGCVTASHKGAPGTCTFENLDGIEFQFRERTDHREGYNSYSIVSTYFDSRCGLHSEDWFHTISMPYKSYAGLRGKIVSDKPVFKNDFCEIYEVVMENCLKTFVRPTYISQDMSTVEKFNKSFPGDICFQSDINSARELISKTIWVNFPEQKPYPLFLKDEPTNCEVRHLTPLTVTGIYTDPVRPGKDFCPFYLTVLTENRKVALFPYVNDLIFTTNPIDDSWPQETIKHIKSCTVAVGMTSEQVTIAKGTPSKIFLTGTSTGVNEQWIYKNLLVNFENEVCTSWESF